MKENSIYILLFGCRFLVLWTNRQTNKLTNIYSEAFADIATSSIYTMKMVESNGQAGLADQKWNCRLPRNTFAISPKMSKIQF